MKPKMGPIRTFLLLWAGTLLFLVAFISGLGGNPGARAFVGFVALIVLILPPYVALRVVRGVAHKVGDVRARDRAALADEIARALKRDH